MQAKLFLTVVLLNFTAIHAQEPQTLPPDELAKGTRLLMDANARLGDLPLKLELAPDRSVGLKAGDAGAILIPDQRLKADKAAKADRKGSKGASMPVGQLWLLKIAPWDNGSALPKDKLRLVTIEEKSKTLELVVFALAIEKAGKQGTQLALYGKDSAPVMRVPLTAAKSKGAAPVVMAARKTGEESGMLELGLLGRFKAEIPVGKPAE
jgi:hypothetical protein